MRIFLRSMLVLLMTCTPSLQGLAGVSGRPSLIPASVSLNFEKLVEPCRVVSDKAAPYTRASSANRLFKTRVAGFRLWASAAQWAPVRTEATEKFDVVLDHATDNVQAVVMTQSGSAPMSSLADLAIQRAKRGDPHSVLTAVENRVVNGHELVCITYESTVKAEVMTFYCYLYSEDQGTIEVIGMTPQELFPNHRAELTELLNGLEILPAGTPMTEALRGPQSASPDDMVEIDPVLLRQEKKRAPAEFPEGVRSPTMPTGFPVETTVDSRPIPVNSPRPNYTEDARANGVEGFVKLRALVGAGGSVTDVRLLLHLPDGLDEEAILAVKQMRFKAAMKDNQPVAYWVTLEVDFNLCNRCVPVTPK